jgi:hypothetical protein
MNFLNILFANHVLRVERRFRDRLDPLDLSDQEVLERYRLPRQPLLELIEMLRPGLQRPTRRNNSISVELQVCLTLRFLATGSFMRVVGDVFGCSNITSSAAVTQVCHLLCQFAPMSISFPTSHREAAASARAFFEIAGLPQVLGAIDCTHIRIKRPCNDADIFVNRKGFCSLNVQAVCNADLSFSNVVARWPGSCHDSFIFHQSALKDFLAEGLVSGYLIGDGGHFLRPFLLTPFRDARTNRERNFNRRLSRTRVTIERAFGVLKSRFRCLDHSGGALQYNPSKACSIVVACCVLHNFALANRVPMPPDFHPEAEAEPEGAPADDSAAGRAERQRIAQLLPM